MSKLKAYDNNKATKGNVKNTVTSRAITVM